jgi:peptidyl-prolyl cis-trans isomerase SurA
MKQLFAPILALLVTLAAPLAQAQMLPSAQKPQMLDRIVAVAEGDVILQSELDRAVSQIRSQYASNPQQLPPQNVLEQQVLQRLILMKLQVQKAQEQGIRVTNDEVNQAVANVARQNKMTTDQLRQAVAQQGLSYAGFRQQLADQVLVQRLRSSVVHDQVQVTDAEINNLLASPTFTAGEVHLAHILVAIPSGANAQQIQQAAGKAKQVEEALQGGMDFKAAAIRYSSAQDALDGGDLGWRRLDQLPPAFVSVVNKMQPGQVTPPMRGPTGFHILKLVGRRKPGRDVVTEYHARQIMIKPSELVSAAQAKQKIDKIYKELTQQHKDFAKLAKADSDDDTTANLGGDMGWFTLKDWGQVVADKLNTLKDGEISKPFQVQGSWHILERLGSRTADRTEENARAKARKAIANRKAEQAYEDYLRQLRSSSYVRVLVPALRTDRDKSDSAS